MCKRSINARYGKTNHNRAHLGGVSGVDVDLVVEGEWRKLFLPDELDLLDAGPVRQKYEADRLPEI